MKDFIIPDFNKCNLNISATLAEFLGAPNKNATLPVLKAELANGYKNVVFICFDGLGMYPLSKNLDKDDFLVKNINQVLLSTFPSTTTNATMSLLSNQLPLEHGWFGWSMHFDEINKNVDIFLNRDSATGEAVNFNLSPLGKINYYFDQTNTDYTINTVFPRFIRVSHPERNNTYQSMEELFSAIQNICQKSGKQFIYAYCPEPDATMHDYGVSCPEAKKLIESISQNMGNLYENVEDTLFIITADHGQIDISDYVNLHADEVLMDMLEIYPFLDARTPAFLVKDGREKEFEKYFRSKYSEDFVLYKSKDLIAMGYFGDIGDKESSLGDYIAIGTYTHKQALLTPISTKFKGHHTSLTEEMEVPLILLAKQRSII